MNKTRYRIIFNKARGMLMAVAETTKSQGKSAGQTHATAQSPEQHAEVTSLDGVWHLKALMASMSLLMAVGPTYAGTVSQIKADTTAKAENQATIGKASNGTPVVGIQTPNAKGVSHNVYTQFDVGSNGVVLNNSRTGATSKLAGAVGANSWLAKGEASVIVNEINSSSASRFEGNLEVAGRMADVIIANPSGINVKGGGFINVNTATLTTGKPIYAKDGTLASYQIKQGTISVAQDPDTQFGLGDNGNAPNYAEILARAVDINAKVQAKQDINVITGSNTVTADLRTINTLTGTGTAPTIGLDVKELGSMYANSIYVVGTATGLGVKNAGTFNAVNNLIVTSAGKIENAGTISQTSKTQGMLTLSTTRTDWAGDINNSGNINSLSLMNIDAGRDINIKEGTVKVASGASAPLIINATRNLNMGDSTKLQNYSYDNRLYTTVGGNLTLDDNGYIGTYGGISIATGGNVVLNNNSTITTSQDIDVRADSNIQSTNGLFSAKNGGIYLQARKAVQPNAASSTASITLTNTSINAGQDFTIYADANVSLTNLIFTKESDGTARVDNLKAYAGNDLTLKNTTQALPTITGNIELTAGNNISLSSTVTDAASTELKGIGGIQVKAKGLTTKNIKLSTDKNIDLITDGGNIVLDSNTQLSSTAGNININALTGDITGRSLNASANSGLFSILAKENVTLESDKVETPVSGASFNKVTYVANNITAKKGINIGSVGSGSVNLSYSLLDSSDGALNISAGQNINIDPEMNIIAWSSGFGMTGSVRTLPLPIPNINLFSANEIKIASGGTISNSYTKLTADKGDIAFSAIKGLTLTAVQSSSSKNTIFSSGNGVATLIGVGATSKGHMAISSGSQLYVNSYNDIKKDENGNIIKDSNGNAQTFTNWDSTNSSTFKSNGILSIKSKYTQQHQNATYTGGAVLIETGSSFGIKQNVNISALGNKLLANDTDLSSTNGDLSIQTGSSLTIDPKLLSLNAIGDYDIRSKKGTLTLKGYKGTSGNGSEQVVNLTTDGGITLIGNSVNVQGANLASKKTINIASVAGNINITPIKNSYSVYSQSQVDAAKKKLDDATARLNFINNLPASYPMDQRPTAQDYINAQEDVDQFTQEWQDFKASNNNTTHALAEITGNNINLFSAAGISISGANLKAVYNSSNATAGIGVYDVFDNPTINIQAAGLLPTPQPTVDQTPENAHLFLPSAIQITSVMDEWRRGKESDANFSQHFYVTPTTLTANNINIKAAGAGADSRVILNAADLKSYDVGSINIDALGDIRLEHTQENYFDKQTSRWTKRGSWGKKKTYTQTIVNQESNAEAVKLTAVKINLKSDGDINAYASIIKAEPSQYIRVSADLAPIVLNQSSINLVAAGKVNLYAVDSSSLVDANTTKKSSWAGIKYKTSSYNDSRYVFEQLPAKLIGDGVNIKSGGDTRLQGTVFKTLGKGATILAAQGSRPEEDAQIIFEGINKTVTESHTRESNSVVWQKQAGQGSTVETLTLPKFEGPVAPTFSAPGGLVVQVPQKGSVRTSIEDLAKQPGNEYLQALTTRKDVSWQAVQLAEDKTWQYEQQGLTAAGAALLAVIVTVATMGSGTALAAGATGGSSTVGLGASWLGAAGVTTSVTGTTVASTLGVMANAAVTSIATQASISLVNNGGDIKATLKELGSKESVRNLVTAVATAGVLNELSSISSAADSSILNKFANDAKSMDFVTNLSGRLGQAVVNSTVSAGVGTVINGGSLSDNLETALLSGVATALQGSLAGEIKGLEDVDYLLHKIAHAAAGCIAGSISQNDCESGAIGASVGEVVAGMFTKPADTATDAEKKEFSDKVLLTTKVIAGTIAAYTEHNANTAMASAENAVSNNYLTSKQFRDLKAAIESCKKDLSCELNKISQYSALSEQNNTSLKNTCAGVGISSASCVQKLNEFIDGQGTAQQLGVGSIAYSRYASLPNTAGVNLNQQLEAVRQAKLFGEWAKVNCTVGMSDSACQAKLTDQKRKELRAALDIISVTPIAGNIISVTDSFKILLTGTGISSPEEQSRLLALADIVSVGFVSKPEKAVKVTNVINHAVKTCSFRGDMEVKTLMGYRPIEQIHTGDWVYSLDELTGKSGFKQVLAQYSNPYDETVYITIKDQKNHNQTIVSNKIHPFFTVPKDGTPQSSEGHIYKGKIIGGQWVDAANLQAGYKLLDANNQWQDIVSVIVKSESLTAYNLTIDQTHTYFIKGVEASDGVWVHNNCWSSLPQAATATGKTTPDGRLLYTFKDSEGKQVTAYQGKDGRWYNPSVYAPDQPLPHGTPVINLNSPNMLGANGTKIASATVWKSQGSKARIDIENPNPGQRPGQIHYQDSNNYKYYYDPKRDMFFIGNSTNPAPKSIQKLLEAPAFRAGIDKALKYLGEK